MKYPVKESDKKPLASEESQYNERVGRKESDKKLLASKESHYNEKVSRSVLKAISWRIIASLTTFIATFFIVKISGYEFSISAVAISLRITLLEATLKIVIYFLHERTWLRISYGKVFSKSRDTRS